MLMCLFSIDIAIEGTMVINDYLLKVEGQVVRPVRKNIQWFTIYQVELRTIPGYARHDYILCSARFDCF